MADLASKHELIQSFVSGLSDFLTTLVPPGQKTETIPLWIYVSGTSTVTWTPDVDYYVLNAAFDGASSTNMTVTVDNSTYAQNHAGGVLKKGAVLASFGANVSATFPQRTRIHAGQKLTVNNASATASGVVLVLEVA